MRVKNKAMANNGRYVLGKITRDSVRRLKKEKSIFADAENASENCRCELILWVNGLPVTISVPGFEYRPIAQILEATRK